MDIKLNFVNESNDINNCDIVILQKNVAPGAGEHAVAWQVIHNCGLGEHHPLIFPDALQVCASDGWGNYTAWMNATYGESFVMIRTGTSDTLTRSGAGRNPAEIAVSNALEQGAIGANIFRAGKLLAVETSLAPGQMAAFQFRPTIWIGAVSQASEGEVMNAAIAAMVDTEISLLGLASADIVMTGGRAGPDATPFVFTLQNIVVA